MKKTPFPAFGKPWVWVSKIVAWPKIDWDDVLGWGNKIDWRP